MKNDDEQSSLMVAVIGIIPVIWFALLVAPYLSSGLMGILDGVPEAMNHIYFQELANIQLKKKMEKEKVNKLLDHISYEDREKLKQYGEILEEEAFVSEQRAYCQGYVDCIQLLAGLGLLKKSTDMEKIISEMKSN